MNKSDKEFDKKIEEEFDKVFEQPSTSNERPSQSERFKNQLQKNKELRKNIIIFRSIAAMSCLVLIVISCLIPVWMKDDETSSPPEVIKYYGDNDIVQVEVSQDFVQEYINTNIPNYNFIFEDCELSDITAIYDKETKKSLLALNLKLDKNYTPVKLTLNIVLNKNYTYSKHSYYIDTPNIEPLENKTIYTKEKVDINYNLFVLIDRKTYNTYLNLNINDGEILNKFKQN